MTPPTGYVEAVRVSGVVKVPDIYTPLNDFIPGCTVGPGDTAVIPEGEALIDDNWFYASTPVEPPKPKPKNGASD